MTIIFIMTHQEPSPDITRVSFRARLARLVVANRAFVVVWLALFIAIIGISMVSPLMPVFAEKMGASGIWLGLAFSGFALSQIPLMPVIGRLSDRYGKKRFLWMGLLIYTAAALGYFWAPGYHELVLFRILSGVGASMVIPIAFSYVGELAPKDYEGRYMGLFTIAMIAGFGIGPVLGGVIHDNISMDATFISMAIFSILGFLVIFFFLPATSTAPGAPSSVEGARPEEPATSFLSMLKDSTIQGVIALQLTFGLLFGTVLAFIGVWMTTTIDTSVAQVGILLSARSIMNGALSYPFGWLADNMNRVILVSVGMGMVAVGTFTIPWLGNFGILLAVFVVIGIFESMAMPSLNAITVEKGRILGMGTVMGMFNMAMSLGLVTGSMVGGVIETSMGIDAVFRFAAVLGLVGIVAFNAFMFRSTRLSRNNPAITQPDTPDPKTHESTDS
ncbi:MAG TPA: MFS transporter [Dehalococcoidia bacterium]|nr:MFS transporter [Dehalococcoidia bacterium]